MTKTKKQLRAEAVERLKNCVAARFDAESIVIALTSGRHGQSDWSLECDKLIYLLTDDDSTTQEDDSTAERGMTNLEWLYEHDGYFNSFAKLMACLRGSATDEFTANEWLRQEHHEPNPDCSAMLYRMYTENMKHEPCNDYEPKDDAVSIMRECAETSHGMGVLRGRLGVECVSGWQMRCLGKLADMIERDYVRRESVEEVMDNDRALVEENSMLARELLKLRAELEKATNNLNSANEDFENARAELTAERDEIAELVGWHGEVDGNSGAPLLVPMVAAMCEGSEVAKKLQAQVDELQAITDERWNKYIAEHLRADTLADDLLTANRQREQYRKLFGMALDRAHEITMLESSVDEGVA